MEAAADRTAETCLAGLLASSLARSPTANLATAKPYPPETTRINPSAPVMSSTAAAIRSGELLACPVALRRSPLAVVSVRARVRGARAAVAVRAEATAEGVGKAKGKGAGERKKRPASGITKPKPISPELREFVGGAAELPRTEAIRLVWAHIKGNNLQDPDNKKIIVCDDKLKKIFGGRDRVGFLEISGLLNPHFPK